MAYYNTNAWSGSPAGNQGPWDSSNQAPRSGASAVNPTSEAFDPTQARSGTTQTGSNEDGESFYYQFASVNRAVETWRKSNKLPTDTRSHTAPRFQPPVEFDPRGPPPGPPQSFFPAGPPPGPPQRFSGARSNEPDPAVQAKRRMAAQRERELRNFHQEQQFHKHLSGAATGPKSDRSMSPANAGMSENDRRDLIARQHRALYGEDSKLYTGENAMTHGPTPQDARATNPSGFRGGSPYDKFNAQNAPAGTESSTPMPSRERQSRSRGNSNASPTSNPANNQQQASRGSTSSPHGSPPRDSDPSGSAAANSVAPIGTRPTPSTQAGGPKRSTPPSSSPLGFEQAGAPDAGNNARSGWGNSGPWGGKGGMSVPAKVWG